MKSHRHSALYSGSLEHVLSVSENHTENHLQIHVNDNWSSDQLMQKELKGQMGA